MKADWQTLLSGLSLAAAMAFGAPALAQAPNAENGPFFLEDRDQEGMESDRVGPNRVGQSREGDSYEAHRLGRKNLDDEDDAPLMEERAQEGMEADRVGPNRVGQTRDPRRWDSDRSGTLDFDEWQAGFNQTSAWDTDRDGSVSDLEYSRGLFDSYDLDDDGFWDPGERQRFQDDAGEGGWLGR